MKDTKAKAKESKKSQLLAPKNDKAKKKQVRKQRKPKDPNQPKRPPTAFFIYLEEFRKLYKEQHPNSKGVAEVAKACGEKWKHMSAEEKAPYNAKAAHKKAEYNVSLSAYTKSLVGARSDHEEKIEKSNPEVDEEEDDYDEEDED